jgi:hypothetical protein
MELGTGIVEVLFQPVGDIVFDMVFESFKGGKEEGRIGNNKDEQYE